MLRQCTEGLRLGGGVQRAGSEGFQSDRPPSARTMPERSGVSGGSGVGNRGVTNTAFGGGNRSNINFGASRFGNAGMSARSNFGGSSFGAGSNGFGRSNSFSGSSFSGSGSRLQQQRRIWPIRISKSGHGAQLERWLRSSWLWWLWAEWLRPGLGLRSRLGLWLGTGMGLGWRLGIFR